MKKFRPPGKLINQKIYPDEHCWSCGKTDNHRLNIYSRSFNIAGLSIFPIGVTATDECKNCRRLSLLGEFTPRQLELYRDQSLNLKTPWTQWLGLIMVMAAVLFIGSIITYQKITYDPGPREIKLNEDIDRLTKNVSTIDTIASSLQAYLNIIIVEELSPDDFEYRVVHDDYKTLVLVKVPMLFFLEDEKHPELFNLIFEYLEGHDKLFNADIYMGVLDNGGVTMARSPSGTMYEGEAMKMLLRFYGEPPPGSVGADLYF